jgi:hypothetical protein
MRMRMLHIRNMHQMASAAISPLHEDCPARPRLRKPGADPRLVYHPFLALLALLPLLPTTCNFHSYPSYSHWPSTRHASSTGEASDTSFPEHETAVSACAHSGLAGCGSDLSVARPRGIPPLQAWLR